ncbi:A/G-specific adenine glycosylase [Candidatus Saccharibacteria bacterium]|nr:MAG: A/G-specific adenine glycosylase [Candidatus Saccharibacteria bacterium]
MNEFQELVREKGRELYREMPWRTDPSPYRVLVSELMLQQTQVSRVVPKFENFMRLFPNVEALAGSSLDQVLIAWSGLGYNRRAKFLWQAALEVMLRFDGDLPDDLKALTSLPGIGPNTGAAILNYAYEIPTAFVETNIRTVYFHHFFQNQTDIADRDLLEVVERTMDREHPREFFWALMDYGSYLKSSHGARLDQSRHYKKQAPLKGSVREMRGRIIRELTTRPLMPEALKRAVLADDRFEPALADLESEGLVEAYRGQWRLKT